MSAESEPTVAGGKGKTVTANESCGKGDIEDWATGEKVDTRVESSKDAVTHADVVARGTTWVVAHKDVVAPADVSWEVNTRVVTRLDTVNPTKVAEEREPGVTAFWPLLMEADYEAK